MSTICQVKHAYWDGQGGFHQQRKWTQKAKTFPPHLQKQIIILGFLNCVLLAKWVRVTSLRFGYFELIYLGGHNFLRMENFIYTLFGKNHCTLWFFYNLNFLAIICVKKIRIIQNISLKNYITFFNIVSLKVDTVS